MSKNTALSLKENQPLKEKIAAILKQIADAVEKFFKGDKDLKLSAHNRYAQKFLDDVQALRDMAELVSKGFETARENEREFGERKSGGQRFAKGKKKQHYAKQGGEWSEALTGAE